MRYRCCSLWWLSLYAPLLWDSILRFELKKKSLVPHEMCWCCLLWWLSLYAPPVWNSILQHFLKMYMPDAMRCTDAVSHSNSCCMPLFSETHFSDVFFLCLVPHEIYGSSLRCFQGQGCLLQFYWMAWIASWIWLGSGTGCLCPAVAMIGKKLCCQVLCFHASGQKEVNGVDLIYSDVLK